MRQTPRFPFLGFVEIVGYGAPMRTVSLRGSYGARVPHCSYLRPLCIGPAISKYVATDALSSPLGIAYNAPPDSPFRGASRSSLRDSFASA